MLSFLGDLAHFQKVARTSYSMLFTNNPAIPTLTTHSGKASTTVPSVSAVMLGAGWGPPENSVCPTSSYQRCRAKSRDGPSPWVPFWFPSENGRHSPSGEAETQTSLSQWAHKRKKKKPAHKCQNPLKTLAATGKPGSNLRSTARREIMVLKDAKRKNYWQKQSSYYIKMKERLSGSAATCSSAKASLKRQRRRQEPIQHVDQAAPIRSVGLSKKKTKPTNP